jgi:hypothetical protein
MFDLGRIRSIRKTLAASAAVGVLGGCAGAAVQHVTPLTAHLVQAAASSAAETPDALAEAGAPLDGLIVPDKTRRFKASYSGTATGECRSGAHGAVSCRFALMGTGRGKHIHKSNISGTLTCRAVNGRAKFSGMLVLDSIKRPANGLTMTVSGKSCAVPPVTLAGNYKVTSGTGKFATATGSGGVSITFSASSGTASSTWSGKLIY